MYLHLATAVLAATTAHAQATTSVTAIFQLPGDYIPSSLEASVVTSYDITTPGLSPTFVVAYRADCAKESSPQNNACRSLSLYPADFYHTQGSVWGGVMKNGYLKRTTTWECSLGGMATGTGDNARDATCHSTVVSETKILTNGTEHKTNACDLIHASVPLVITAGVEKLQQYTWLGKAEDVSTMLSYDAIDASAIGCPSRPSLKQIIVDASPTSSKGASTSSTIPTLTSTTATSALPGAVSASQITSAPPSISSLIAVSPSTTSSRSAAAMLSFGDSSIWLIIAASYLAW